MRVLVACEYSGRVRDAFLALGHDAVSCDLLPTEVPGPHVQGDVLDLLYGDTYGAWDLLIAHPPCTILSKAGVRWLHSRPERWSELADAARFFKTLLDAPVAAVAVENPVMHRYATELIGVRHSQIVQPHEFGHAEAKATALWLRGLPPLLADVDAKAYSKSAGGAGWTNSFGETKDRWKQRSRTFEGVAAAMASQWSRHFDLAAL